MRIRQYARIMVLICLLVACDTSETAHIEEDYSENEANESESEPAFTPAPTSPLAAVTAIPLPPEGALYHGAYHWWNYRLGRRRRYDACGSSLL